jgi:hypothetical protein
MLVNRIEQDKYKNCYTSDLIRMEIIDEFLNKIEEDSEFNIDKPNNIKLIDDWYGYEHQIYIQNNLVNNEIIYYEGWVDACWNGIKVKPEYKGLTKIQVIEKLISDRFPVIANEFDLKVMDYEIYKTNGNYIMKIILSNYL